MTKAKEKKLRNQIVDLLKQKKMYESTDDLLITELLDWLSISEYAKGKLKKDFDSWNTLTTIGMASKQIQSLLTKLNITVQERNRKVKVEIENNEGLDLKKFLNEN